MITGFVQTFLQLWVKLLSYVLPFVSSIFFVSERSQKGDENGEETVNFLNCIPALDEKLLSLSLCQCRELFQHFQKINNCIYLMKELSLEFKNNGISLSTSQSQRIAKMCESLTAFQLINYPLPIFSTVGGDSKQNTSTQATDEMILNHYYYYQVNGDLPFQPSMVSPASINIATSPTSGTTNTQPTQNISKNIADVKCLYTYLPDVNYIHYFIQKTRNQLKSMEEMLNSKKNDHLKFKFSGKKTLFSLINQFSSPSGLSSFSSSSLSSAGVMSSQGPSINNSNMSSFISSSSGSNKNFDLSILKYLIKELTLSFQSLELYLSEQSLMFSYFQHMKQELHYPYYQILLNIKLLPNFYEIERKLSMEYEHHLLQEKTYSTKINPNNLSSSSSSSSSSSIEKMENGQDHKNKEQKTKNSEQSGMGINRDSVQSVANVKAALSAGNNTDSNDSSGAEPNILFKMIEILQEYQLLSQELIQLLMNFSKTNDIQQNPLYYNTLENVSPTANAALNKNSHSASFSIHSLTVQQKEIIKLLFAAESEEDIKNCLCFQ
jgi:hypothetical protein